MEILFENEAFIAVDKPSAWLSIPSRFPHQDKRAVVQVELSQHSLHPIFPIHRLDTGVSGVLLFAKTAEAHRAANAWFESRQVVKTYYALTEFDELPEIGKVLNWEHRMVRGKKRSFIADHGKTAQTVATPLNFREVGDDSLVLWLLEPITGRSHQLRLHLAMHGFPIWGDTLYGAKIPPRSPGQIGLRCVQLNFEACVDALEFDLPPRLGDLDIECNLLKIL